MKSFIKSTLRVLKITRKPTRESFKMSLKICSLATILLGAIGFTVQFMASILQMISPPTPPRELVLYVLVGLIVAILAVIAYRRRSRAL